MRTERTFKDAVGKVIEGFEFSGENQMVITFTDGTFVTLGIDPGWHGDPGTIKPDKLKVFDFGDEQLVGLGIVTEVELEAKRSASEEARRARVDTGERLQYDRLKAKFGGE